MEKLHEPKSDALRAMFWRDEILQVMYWIEGEKFPGVGNEISPSLLERFLGVDARIGVSYLDKLVEEGLLESDGSTYSLTPDGRKHGGRVFGDEFSELTRPGHGECGPDCWCHANADEAEACAAERVTHLHDPSGSHDHHNDSNGHSHP